MELDLLDPLHRYCTPRLQVWALCLLVTFRVSVSMAIPLDPRCRTGLYP